jgi:hypothetical protein
LGVDEEGEDEEGKCEECGNYGAAAVCPLALLLLDGEASKSKDVVLEHD